LLAGRAAGDVIVLQIGLQKLTELRRSWRRLSATNPRDGGQSECSSYVHKAAANDHHGNLLSGLESGRQ
jgi:hypothetical protein